MTFIRIVSSQIKEVLLETKLVEGKNRLPIYYAAFQRLEGVPIIEKLQDDTFRLITYYENYQFYKTNEPSMPFECELKSFENEEERHLELLNQLFHGKARSSSKDKYYIINFLNRTLTADEIALKSNKDLKKIEKFIYENDRYKVYLENAMEAGRNSIMENVVSYLKKHDIFKEETEEYLLNLGSKLTWNYWNITKFVLESISLKFCVLPWDKQVKLLKEWKTQE